MSTTLRWALPAAALLLVACSTATTPAPTSAPSANARPTFRLALAGPADRTYESVPEAVRNACDLPASGPWTFSYLSASPSLDITLSIRDGAATTAGSENFRLDISPGDSENLSPSFIDGLGVRSGSHGSSGTVEIAADSAARVITVTGEAYAPRATGLFEVELEVRCPVPPA